MKRRSLDNHFDKHKPSLYKKPFTQIPLMDPDFDKRIGLPQKGIPIDGFWAAFHRMGFSKEDAVRVLGYNESDIKHIANNPMEYLCFSFLYSIAYVLDLSIESAFMYVLKYSKSNAKYRHRAKENWKKHEHKNRYIGKKKVKSLMERYGVKDLDELLSRQDLIRMLEKDAQKTNPKVKKMKDIRAKIGTGTKVKDILPGLYH